MKTEKVCKNCGSKFKEKGSWWETLGYGSLGCWAEHIENEIQKLNQKKKNESNNNI